MGRSKYYAVRKGKTPGVYTDWDSCQAVTKGFPGAEFKSFSTREEALAYLGNTGARPAAAPPQQRRAQGAGASHGAHAGTSAGTKWYAIQHGHKTGVFSGNWNRIKPLVEGCSGARYKSFSTRDEAEQWLRAGGGAQAAAAAGDSGPSLSGSKRAYSAIAEQQPPPAFSAGYASSAAAGTGTGAAGIQQQQQQQGDLMVTIHFDGGSRGNPGRSGYGYAITDRRTGQQLRVGCKPLPYGSTNNEAEYSGMIAGLRYARDVLAARHVVVKGDSQLAVKQIKGEYRVNSEKIAPLFREAKQLQEAFASFEIQHVYREDNSLADSLSNIAMDTDLVVDQIAAGRVGSTRRQMALALARACQLDQHYEQWQPLCTADSFLSASAALLSRVWDNTPVEEVIAQLNSRGWDEHTGGPPEPPPPAAAAGGDVNGGAGRGVSGRGGQTVAVAAVSLGPQWAAEISRQEQLMRQTRQQQQQQQQQQQRQGVHNRSGGGGGGAGAAAGQGSLTGFQALSGLSTGPPRPGSSFRRSSFGSLTGHTAINNMRSSSSSSGGEAACWLSAAAHGRCVSGAGRMPARAVISSAAAADEGCGGVGQHANVSRHRPPGWPPVLQASLRSCASVGGFEGVQQQPRLRAPHVDSHNAGALLEGVSSSRNRCRARPLLHCCAAGGWELAFQHAAADCVCRLSRRASDPPRMRVAAAGLAAAAAGVAAATAVRLRHGQQGRANSRRAQGLRRC